MEQPLTAHSEQQWRRTSDGTELVERARADSSLEQQFSEYGPHNARVPEALLGGPRGKNYGYLDLDIW